MTLTASEVEAEISHRDRRIEALNDEIRSVLQSVGAPSLTELANRLVRFSTRNAELEAKAKADADRYALLSGQNDTLQDTVGRHEERLSEQRRELTQLKTANKNVSDLNVRMRSALESVKAILSLPRFAGDKEAANALRMIESVIRS